MSTDSEIIRRSLAHPSAFGELFERHSEAIGAYVRARVGAATVDDLVSETFIVAFRKRHRFDWSRPSARPWLFGIATRFVQGQRRAEARQWEAWSTYATRGTMLPVPSVDEADERLEAAFKLRDLAPAIAALPTRERDALLLFALGDLDYRGVAEALNVPIGTVRSRIHRARRRLGDAASDVADGYPPPTAVPDGADPDALDPRTHRKELDGELPRRFA